MLGDSNAAEAWTDGSSYIAIDVKVVKRLKTHPLKTAGYIFSLVEHEVAHEGDSLDSGHDEAFYQRFHDLSLRHAEDRQRYLHMWLMKYTTSMESEGKRARGEAWRERYLVDRVGSGRVKKGLSPAIEDVRNDPVVAQSVPAENMAFIKYQNVRLVEAGLCPPPPDWAEIVNHAHNAQAEIEAKLRQEAQTCAEEDRAYWAGIEADEKAIREQDDIARQRFATILNVSIDMIDYEIVSYLRKAGADDGAVRIIWAEKPWEQDNEYPEHASECDHEQEIEDDSAVEAKDYVPVEVQALVQPGETLWALERNAAAAGFYRVADYLRWRTEDQLQTR